MKQKNRPYVSFNSIKLILLKKNYFFGIINVIFGKRTFVLMLTNLINKNNFTDTVHHSLSNDPVNGILHCGFLTKGSDRYEKDIVFPYYGGLLLLKGSGVYTDDYVGDISLSPGCFIQRLPGVSHCSPKTAGVDWLEFYICIGHDLFLSLSKIGLLSSYPVLYPGLNTALIQKIISFHRNMKVAKISNLSSLLIESLEILFTIYRLDKISSIDVKYSNEIQQACIILGNNFDTIISTKDIAQKFGMGYENFRKIFKETIGMSPGTFRIQKKINVARSMLINKNCSINNIAAALGYPDSFSFSRQFKSYTHMSPSTFKKTFYNKKL